ncbi:MAG TPA: secondary thiamine-phosphate synthase enzyme YjbQ [Bryobacteraceae bacterium]|nr:secondary thiamine-phosphate synthase enzyme YjbQ [Bryobacteraceae bacterium]
MPVVQKPIRLSTRGNCDVIDLTSRVASIVADSGIRCGIVSVAGRGSTLGITTIEYESGAVADLRRALERIAPANDEYAHNARWGDHNGFAHLRSALLGTTETYPVRGGALLLGTWQQIILCDFDDRPRDREITVTVCGE